MSGVRATGGSEADSLDIRSGTYSHGQSGLHDSVQFYTHVLILQQYTLVIYNSLKNSKTFIPFQDILKIFIRPIYSHKADVQEHKFD